MSLCVDAMMLSRVHPNSKTSFSLSPNCLHFRFHLLIHLHDATCAPHEGYINLAGHDASPSSQALHHNHTRTSRRSVVEPEPPRAHHHQDHHHYHYHYHYH
ncbi:hypothetical protein ACJQWK_11427 [Exserohilum turcicum]